MSFGESIKTVFKNLTNFKGRARRSEFWWFYLFIFLVSLPVSLIVTIPMFAAINAFTEAAGVDGTVTDAQVSQFLGTIAVIYGLLFLFSLVTFFFTLAVWVRRLHDAGYSGHWMWFCLAGLSIVPLILAILEGQPYPNQWGPDPKAIEHQVWPHRQAGPAFTEPTPPPATASGTTTDPFAAPPRDN